MRKLEYLTSTFVSYKKLSLMLFCLLLLLQNFNFSILLIFNFLSFVKFQPAFLCCSYFWAILSLMFPLSIVLIKKRVGLQPSENVKTDSVKDTSKRAEKCLRTFKAD